MRGQKTSPRPPRQTAPQKQGAVEGVRPRPPRPHRGAGGQARSDTPGDPASAPDTRARCAKARRDPLDAWPTFAGAIRARLEQGRKVYGDRSFTREPEELRGEIEEELLDVCAWSFVLWVRVRALEGRG